MRRESLSILKACSYIFYLICASGSHVTWNSAVPDPNVWCCILLFLCTLGKMQKWRNFTEEFVTFTTDHETWASSWLFPSINFQFRTETFLSIFLGWLKWPARFWEADRRGPSRRTRQNLDTTALSVRKQTPPKSPPKTIVMSTCEQNDQKKWLVEGISKITRTAHS